MKITRDGFSMKQAVCGLFDAVKGKERKEA